MGSIYDELSEELEERIEYIWKYRMKDDLYNRIFLYSEQELVASFCYHLRDYIKKREYDEIRLFLEVYSAKDKKRYDMLIMGEDKDFPWTKHPILTRPEGETLFALEFKFVPKITKESNIKKDIRKLIKIKEERKTIRRVYFAFVGKQNLYMIRGVIKEFKIEENDHIRFLFGYPTNRTWKNWDFSVWNTREVIKGEKITRKVKKPVRKHKRKNKGK